VKSKSVDDILINLIRSALLLSANTDSLDLSSIDWDALVSQAQRQRLAPLLYISLKRLDSRIQPPENCTKRLHLDYLHTTSVNLAIFNETAKFLARLREEKIPVILLKGVALANGLYDDIGIRMLGDLDILIRIADRMRVKDLLITQGYTILFDIAEGFRDEYSSEQSYVHLSQSYLGVDVHWHLFNIPYFRQHVSMEWFWEQTMPVKVDREVGLMLTPQSQLIHLVAHYALHHRAQGLRWSFDIALLVTQCSAAIDWEATIAAAREFRMTRALQSVLGEVEQVWGVRLPEAARTALSCSRPTFSDHVAFRLLTAPRSGATVVWNAWSTPGVRGKLTYLLRHVYPEKLYMAQLYRVADARVGPMLYARYFLRGIASLVCSIVSVTAELLHFSKHTHKR
jgi:hypothetical protein